MKEQISALERDLNSWRVILNQEGVWLFLASLGCWSVPEGWLRFCAVVIAGFLFGWRAFSQQHDLRSIPNRFSEMEKQIREFDSEASEKKLLLDELTQLRSEHFSLKSTGRSIVYFVASAFFLLTFFYAFGG